MDGFINYENGFVKISVLDRPQCIDEAEWSINETSRISLDCWCRKESVRLSMTLAGLYNIERPIDTRQLGLDPLRYINLHYRGLSVPTTKSDRMMPYPCWDINAYAMFGSAEQYVGINRNNLLPDKIYEVYQRIIKCADEVLSVFWLFLYKKIADEKGESSASDVLYKHINSLGNNKIPDFEWEYQLNALALSALYHQVVSHFIADNKKEYRWLDKLVPILMRFSTIGIAAMNRKSHDLSSHKMEFIESLPAPRLHDVFYDGIDTQWFISKSQFITRKLFYYELLPDGPTLLIQDIFSDYLQTRQLSMQINRIYMFRTNEYDDIYINPSMWRAKPVPHIFNCFAFAYKLPTAYGQYYQFDEKEEANWLEALVYTLYVRYHREYKSYTKEQQQLWNSLIITPNFLNLDVIRMKKLPKDTCSEELWSLGVCTVLPLTYFDLLRFIEQGIVEPSFLLTTISTDDLPVDNPYIISIRINTLVNNLIKSYFPDNLLSYDTVKWNYIKATCYFLNQIQDNLISIIKSQNDKFLPPLPMDNKEKRELLRKIFVMHQAT